jgi:hypothetical protein
MKQIGSCRHAIPDLPCVINWFIKYFTPAEDPFLIKWNELPAIVIRMDWA